MRTLDALGTGWKGDGTIPPEHRIPPEILKPAAESIYDRVPYGYDLFSDDDSASVLALCGQAYASIPPWRVKVQVVKMRKRPHGDPLRLRQDKRRQRKVRRWLTSVVRDAAIRICEPDWPDLAEACKRRDGYRCRTCGATEYLQAHHLSYSRVRKPGEIHDLTTLCDRCHAVVTALLRHPQEVESLARRLLEDDRP